MKWEVSGKNFWRTRKNKRDRSYFLNISVILDKILTAFASSSFFPSPDFPVPRLIPDRSLETLKQERVFKKIQTEKTTLQFEVHEKDHRSDCSASVKCKAVMCAQGECVSVENLTSKGEMFEIGPF